MVDFNLIFPFSPSGLFRSLSFARIDLIHLPATSNRKRNPLSSSFALQLLYYQVREEKASVLHWRPECGM
jgi:hypothetical protein